MLAEACCKLDYQVGVVGLDLCLVCGLVSYYRAAPLALVDDNVAALGIGLCPDGAQNAAAGVCPVSGVYVNV